VVRLTDGDGKVYSLILTLEVDTLAPALTLNGAADVQLTVGDAYTELGVQALDNKDGDISSSVQMSGSVDTNTPGTYTVTYTVKDKAGNASEITRTVVVQEKLDTIPPSKVSEDLPWIDFAGESSSGTMTLSEDISSVSDAKFVDAKTGATLSGGAVAVSVDPTNSKVVNVNYTINAEWGSSYN
jgi:PKD repeat protein